MSRKTKPDDYKHYIGDTNLEYGGKFFDLSDYDSGTVSALEVTELPDFCVMVNRIDIITDDAELIEDALECCGQTMEDLPEDEDQRKLWIAYAVSCYQADSDPYFQPLLIVTDKEYRNNRTVKDYAKHWNAKIVVLRSNQDVFTYLRGKGYLRGYK